MIHLHCRVTLIGLELFVDDTKESQITQKRKNIGLYLCLV